ncbi:NAD-dependent succinate-semialdehyde dehydrogenase [Phenylobacterium sp.]|uniref:NAD-dependent succinate-semialdehyde dehydrogenase n=1 Tax=Phenylobacterium sp. TaxID=1871053 RepID=UPI002FCC5137
MADGTAAASLLQDVRRWADRQGIETRFGVFNPANGALVGEAPDMGAGETEAAIAAAAQALPAWAAQTAKARAEILRRWRDLILHREIELAHLLTAEQGKPFEEALGEVRFGASFIEWFAEEGRRLYGDVIPSHAPGKRLLTLKQPIGVVAAITPWNFPNGMVARKVAPALAAGCCVVLKPAEDTPLSAIALAILAAEAGVPPDAFRVVTAKAPAEVAETLTASPTVRKLSFTGSTPVGKLLMRQCAATVKKVSLELGGNAPFIVFEDADLDAAVAGAVASKFRNAGQTCVSANRIYVQASIMEAFAARFSAAVAKLVVGEGANLSTNVGPLINAAALGKVDGLVRDAVAKGALAVLGGERHPRRGTFYRPTILTGVTADMEIAHAEIFGPVAPLFTFETEAEVVRRANDTPYGLAAYFWTRDIGRAFRVGEALEYGMVGLNEGLISSEAAPFGGIKESGIGREGSKYGLEDYVEIKYLLLGGLA